MTTIFCYGSLNLTKMFGIAKESDVQDELRPYLYRKGDDILLNVTVRNRRDASMYGQTHTLSASKKGVPGFYPLADLVEYIRPQQQPQQQATYPQYQQQQPQPQPQSQHQGGFDGGGYGVDF